jgi:multiple antibiotic resistance protein
MQNTLQAIVTVLTLINPAICAATFMRIEAGRPPAEQLADATRSVLAVLVILLIAALAGAQLLDLFGISMDAFMVAGGAVLACIGFAMLRGPGDSNGRNDAAQGGKPSLTPLILFAASPGTITGVITLAVAHTGRAIPVTALVAVGVAAAVLWLVLALAVRFGGRRRESSGFVRDTITRFMGLIVIAMGVQFALTGVRAFMVPPAAEPESATAASLRDDRQQSGGLCRKTLQAATHEEQRSWVADCKSFDGVARFARCEQRRDCPPFELFEFFEELPCG